MLDPLEQCLQFEHQPRHSPVQAANIDQHSSLSATALSEPRDQNCRETCKQHLSPAQLLLHDYIKNLPLDAASPFNVDIFDDSPSYRRSYRINSYPVEEDDAYGKVHKWTEDRLELEPPKRHGAHSVTNGWHKLMYTPGRYIEGFCRVWTRKQRNGWGGICMSDTGELLDLHDSSETQSAQGNEQVWIYIAAVTCVQEDKEWSLQCVVPTRDIEVDGVVHELEPSWQDVVNVLRQAALLEERQTSQTPQQLFPANHDHRQLVLRGRDSGSPMSAVGIWSCSKSEISSKSGPGESSSTSAFDAANVHLRPEFPRQEIYSDAANESVISTQRRLPFHIRQVDKPASKSTSFPLDIAYDNA